MKKQIATWLRKAARKLDPLMPLVDPGGDEVSFIIREQDPFPGRPIKWAKVWIRPRGGILNIFVDGYGTVVGDRRQEILSLEIWDGRLRVAYWPSHRHSRTIDLENARTSARTTESGHRT